ncbi:MAG TPA: hypothetical protein VMU54_18755 [Planctomycetota bacterium]|nr:hypothetical protein [Planctomycetota bacterium]
MSQPVKLSDDLILDARLTGKIVHRSIAGQIEFWAQLGRAIEPLLDGLHVVALQKAGKARSLSSCLDSVDTPSGRRRVIEHLQTVPFPHYEANPRIPGTLIRIGADGKRTIGRFIDRKFQAVD